VVDVEAQEAKAVVEMQAVGEVIVTCERIKTEGSMPKMKRRR
jgi:hypothetical protein